jgi:hypothetical protein
MLGAKNIRRRLLLKNLSCAPTITGMRAPDNLVPGIIVLKGSPMGGGSFVLGFWLSPLGMTENSSARGLRWRSVVADFARFGTTPLV